MENLKQDFSEAHKGSNVKRPRNVLGKTSYCGVMYVNWISLETQKWSNDGFRDLDYWEKSSLLNFGKQGPSWHNNQNPRIFKTVTLCVDPFETRGTSFGRRPSKDKQSYLMLVLEMALSPLQFTKGPDQM